ncbi:MAG: GxxExxY protein [Phycisphaeraceae bacterium]|nr:GxxExxY protein [Phycisphaeraceae bacterium]
MASELRWNDREYGGGGGEGQYGRRRRGVPLSELDPGLTDLSRRVIGASIEVHKALGPGYDREVYANALIGELDAAGIGHKRGHSFDVKYNDRLVGSIQSDLYVGDRFLVDVLAFHGEVGSGERARLRAQLRAADLELGLIINFGERRLKDGLVRVLNPDKIPMLQHDRDDDDGVEDED